MSRSDFGSGLTLGYMVIDGIKFNGGYSAG